MVTLCGPSAGADGQICGDGPTMTVAFLGDGWSAAETERVMNELIAAAHAQGVLACRVTGESGPTLARVELTRRVDEPVSVLVEVFEGQRRKRFHRRFDASAFPRDSRALALAVAIDELFRASRIYLTMHSAQRAGWRGSGPLAADLAPGATSTPRVLAPPAPVLEGSASADSIAAAELAAVTELAAPRVGSNWRYGLGLRARSESYRGGVSLFGGEVSAWAAPAEGWSFALELGAGKGLEQVSMNGRTAPSALGASLSLNWRALSAGRVALSASAGTRALYVRYDASAQGMAQIHNGGSVAWLAALGTTVSVPLGPVALQVDVSLNRVLRAVAALDTGDEIFAVSGIGVSAGIGVGVEL